MGTSFTGRPWYDIHAQADDAVRVDILGPIGWEGTSATEFVASLNELRGVGRIDVHLSSPGGAAFDGVTIYNNLRKHPAMITMNVDGLAASAASIIAMAGDEIIMNTGSMMMVHNGRGAVLGGDAEDFRAAAVMLDEVNASMADIYARRAGGTTADWLAVMASERWFRADAAVSAGLADRVDDDSSSRTDDDEMKAAIEWGRTVLGYRGPEPGYLIPEGVRSDLLDIAALVSTPKPDPDPLAALAAWSPPDPPDYIAQLAAMANDRKVS
jgi:ATP-dependent protease ClpP protease subunit